MKIYDSIDEWSKDWTQDKQKRYEEVRTLKYGKHTKDESLLIIDDKELSGITGVVRFTIPIKDRSL
jgi:hypothetical protein